MIPRIWRIQTDPTLASVYEGFASTQSRGKFESLPGCLGALFIGDEKTKTAITFWTAPAPSQRWSHGVFNSQACLPSIASCSRVFACGGRSR